MNLTTRYNLGDVVWHVRKFDAQRAALCDLCAGTGRVKIVPDVTRTATCPECHGRRFSQTEKVYAEKRATITRLTIGLIRTESRGRSTTYTFMAEETGIGSGSVYNEAEAHPTYEDALAVCEDVVVVFHPPGKVLVNRGSADELVTS